jgi:dynein heavy chain
MRALLKRDIVVDDKLLLKSVWDFKLYEFKDGIEEITDQAKQELKMEK